MQGTTDQLTLDGSGQMAIGARKGRSCGRRAAKVVYIARNDGTDMRVSKECNSLLHAGYDVTFVGWDMGTEGRRPDPMPDVPKRLFRSGNGNSVSQKLRQLPFFVQHVVRSVKDIQPDVVHSVNEELGLLAVCLQRAYGFKSICDIFDSVEMVWGHKGFPIRTFAHLLSVFVHRVSDVLIVTDEARKGHLGPYASKAWIVSNYPVDVGADVAFDLPDLTAPIRLYVAGSLSQGRGLSSIRQLLETEADVEVIAAGWLYDDTARSFVEHPRVDYQGILTPSESLRLAANCHAIVALYEPNNKNNILASPNKIYDALCIGRPTIINKEARVSEWVLENNAGYVIRYGNLADLVEVKEKLHSERVTMRESIARLRQLYESGYSWEVAERKLLSAYEACIPANAGAM